MSNLHPALDTDWWRPYQQRLFIRGCPKQIAHKAGVCLDSLYRWGRADYPVPAHQLFRVSAAQRDFSYAAWLAEQAGAILSLSPVTHLYLPTIQLLADLMRHCGRFFQISQKVQDGEPLTDEEMREYEAVVEQMKQRADALVQRARERRQHEEEKSDGC